MDNHLELLASLTVSFRFFHHFHTDSEFTDLSLPLSHSFQQLVNSFKHLLPESTSSTVCGFIYRDSEQDVVTVRSSDEMPAFLHSVVFSLSKNTAAPFNLYPRFLENVHGLVLQLNIHTPPKSPVSEPTLGAKTHSVESGITHFEFQASMLNKYNFRIEDMHFLEHVSAGNGRNVYKASYLPNRMVVALKQIPLDVSLEEQNSIMSELNVLWLCDSPYIIKFYGALHIDCSLMFITEYMDGKSLQASARVPEAVLGKITFCVIEGVKYLWSLKILHRDVKPSNILVNTKGEIKLCDFGVSTQLVKSMARTFIGTNAYMAPERIRGEEYSIQSEVWSIGITVMELGLGKFPYEFADRSPSLPLGPLDMIQSILNEPPPRLPAHEHSPELRGFVGRCMEKEPAIRPGLDDLLNLGLVTLHKKVTCGDIAAWEGTRERRAT